MKHKTQRPKKKIVAVVTCALTASVATPLLMHEANAADPRICINGTLKAEAREAEVGNAQRRSTVRGASWKLFSDKEELAGGFTADNGSFNACHTSSIRKNNLRVVFASSTAYSQILQLGAQRQYTFDSGSLGSSSQNLGDVLVRDTQENQLVGRAFKMLDTLNDLYARRSSGTACWTIRQQPYGCGQLKVVWPSTEGAWFVPTTGLVHLKEPDGTSKHTALHEAGHFFMNALLGGTPPSDCKGKDGSGGHQFGEANGLTCAWNEGFADAVAAYVLGDRNYVWGNGTVHELDKDRDRWDVGDKVQDRVGVSLLDMWAADGGWTRTLDVMSKAGAPFVSFQDFLRAKRSAFPGSASSDRAIAQRNGLTYPL
ncbi:hypothetical protein OG735_00860 [Streptomyces sp. NBC_01210]|uniref:hypothetical protein n=1 Tax=Streptomyces sp. NBC_01210 TaxID=2903774 RepID=UPI002E0F97FB|nr:hypothetical protein OG735_00860 [Streptomyces sp. NBC_01210]